MKKSSSVIIAILLGIVMLFGIAGCSSGNQNALQSKIDELQSKIDELQSSVNESQSDKDKLQSKIDELQSSVNES